jgi:hypothetical protein
MSGSTQDTSHLSRIVPAHVETGQVIDVDIEMHSVTVVTQYTQKPLVGVAFATPYQHFTNGEGIYFMPEVGSLVWLCWPSDGSRPFVMGWAPARGEDGGLRANKMALNPGDIYLGTRDENFIILRRGGILQIGGGPLSQRMYLPIENTIKDFCENYGLYSVAGELEWTVDRVETTTDGTRPGRLTIRAREFANDKNPIATLQIGSHKDNTPNILSLNIDESGAEGAAKKQITLELRKDGSALLKCFDKIEIYSGNDLTVYAKKTLALLGKNVVVDANQVAITGKNGVQVITPVLEVVGNLSVKGNIGAANGATGSFLSYTNQTIHVSNGIITSIS